MSNIQDRLAQNTAKHTSRTATASRSGSQHEEPSAWLVAGVVGAAALTLFAGGPVALFGGWAAADYVNGFTNPQPRGSLMRTVGSEHGEAVSKFIQGMKMSVECNFENGFAKLTVQDGQTAPGASEIREVKECMNAKLQEAYLKSINLKPSDFSPETLQLIGTGPTS